MDFMKAAYTDIGIRKKTNQDSYSIKAVETRMGTMVMSVICDGMGGLSKGEVASATMIHAFSKWFANDLPGVIAQIPMTIQPESQSVQWMEECQERIKQQWLDLIDHYNEKIAMYGDAQSIQLGTTLTVLLLFDLHFMMICHVGDTRIYKLNRDKISLLTEDQTVVEREIKAGRMSKQQAAKDPRRNVLLQCIGASRIVQPEIIHGNVQNGEVFLLCSDGFRHQITEQEIKELCSPTTLQNEQVMQEGLKELTKRDMQRNETDNITGVLVKIL